MLFPCLSLSKSLFCFHYSFWLLPCEGLSKDEKEGSSEINPRATVLFLWVNRKQSKGM